MTASGSKPVRPRTSKCYPVWLEKRTRPGHYPGTSQRIFTAWCMWRTRRCANGAPCLISLPPRPKRYGWLRIYNGFWDHAKWKAVARLAFKSM